MVSHSKTVRGTLSHPKSSLSTSRNNPPQLGDPISLSKEHDDSVPLSSIPDFSRADPYRQNEGKTSRPIEHSKRVRGTLGNSAGPEVNKSMLGDPVSMKAETSGSEWGRGAWPREDEEGFREAAKRRGMYEEKMDKGKRKSKL
ncbi:hypothetical protein EJ04DRAFT_549894 [Polyplosphaeria fusca]|uniref:Uncharacterized protein n=1 Tax=Polyplosphaeria fusca TaxID=682080 RepID=A0A9P4R3B8_9PLEO|nr:hypothetical protein EJ04DRAFT_549894 [Polyplosphaeria fusca]